MRINRDGGLVSRCAFLALVLFVSFEAQGPLQITSPAGGATVIPGQKLTVTVAAGGSFQAIAVRY